MNGLKYTAFGALSLMLFQLVIATFFEKMYGSYIVQEYIYHSPLFIFLWVAIAVAAMIYMVSATKRPAVIMLHSAFVLVLAGALITFFTSKRGEVELSLNAAQSSMFINHKGNLERMPFRMSLLELDTDYEKDLMSPMDYSAAVEVSAGGAETDTLSLSMNNPMLFKRHSFCIKSISPSSVRLYVSYDPIGMPVTYSGYLMIIAAFIVILVSKESGFRRLLARVRRSKDDRDLGFEANKKQGVADKILLWSAVPAFIALTVAGVLRWYNTRLFPATNSHETMFLLAWSSLLLGIVAFRHSRFLFKAMSLMAPLAIAVALFSFGGSAAVIPPILRTPLLGLHVTAMILAYSLLGCVAVNAAVSLWYRYVLKNEKRFVRGADVSRIIMYPATMLLAVGIIIGSVWANISWGRYWGWDPKEVWALITLIVCSFTLHSRSLSLMARPLFFHLFCIAVFIAMMFTYFGVNYMLGGFHSYV